MSDPLRYYSFKISRKGFKIGEYLIRCRIEFICVNSLYAGYTLLYYSNKSFVRKILSNVSILFEPKHKHIFYTNDVLQCVLSVMNDENNSGTLMFVAKGESNTLPGMYQNKLLVLRESMGGKYIIGCNYTTTFGEIRYKTKTITIIVAPYLLYVDRTKIKTREPVRCYSNGYPYDNYKFNWYFYDGEWDFTLKLNDILVFELYSPLGYYAYLCTLSTKYNNKTYYLEKIFNFTVYEHDEQVKLKFEETKSYVWMLKIVIAFLFAYIFFILFLLRIFTFMRLQFQVTGFLFLKIFSNYRDDLILKKYCVNFEPHSRLCYTYLLSQLNLISHYYIPLDEEDLTIDLDSNLLFNTALHNVPLQKLKHIEEIIEILKTYCSRTLHLLNQRFDNDESFFQGRKSSISSFRTESTLKNDINFGLTLFDRVLTSLDTDDSRTSERRILKNSNPNLSRTQPYKEESSLLFKKSDIRPKRKKNLKMNFS